MKQRALLVVTPGWRVSLAAARGVPYRLYLYGEELPNHPALLRHAIRRAAVTIAISRHTRELASFAGAQTDRCALVPPGVDLPADEPAQPEPGLIVTVARLTDRYKGHDVVLAALPLVREHVPLARWVVVGAGPDAVDDGRTGLLVDPESPEAVAAALVRLLEDRALAARLGAAGSAKAEAHAWPRIAAQVQDLLVATCDSALFDAR